MASLQTLRNRGGVIVAVVIGIALLAFVLGDLLTSGSTLFGRSRMNVGEINGQSITSQEYAAQIDKLTEIQQISTGEQNSSEEQTESIKSQAWQSMITKYAFNPSVEKLGLAVGETELTSLIAGDNVSPLISQIFTNPETGAFDHNLMVQFINNVEQDKTGRLAMFWTYMQQQIAERTLTDKYNSLVTKGAYVTNFEAKMMASIQSTIYDVRFVASRYESIPDSTVKVTTDAARKFYDQNKSMFYRSATTRNIEYVTFEANPSDEDFEAAKEYVTGLATEFQQTDNVEQFATLNSQDGFDARYYSEGILSGDLGTFAFTATTDQLYGPVLLGDQYTLARVSAVKVLPDSIDFSHIVIDPNKATLADSIATELRKTKGANFAELASQYSLDTQSANKGGNVGTVEPQTMSALFSEPLLKSTPGDIVVVNTPNGIHVIKVNRLIGAGKKVQMATIKYTVEASEKTRNEAFAQANSFVGKATNGKAFNETVNASGAVKRNATVNSNDRMVNGIKNSRTLAQWTYNGKAGDVSQVYEFGDMFLIAQITMINEMGVAPFDEVKDKAENLVRRELKGQMLAEKMKGATSIDALASKLALNVIADSAMTFQTFMAPEIGYDPALAGGVSGIKGSELSKPIIGRLGVYAAQVVTRTPQVVDPELERNKMEAEAEQGAFTGAYEELLRKSDIKDERYKFY